jgi:hypothetical protein
MNERIRKLYDIAIQATMDYHDENPRTKQKELDNFCATKLTESIVDECLTICEELGDKGMDGHYCADAISKTFRR